MTTPALTQFEIAVLTMGAEVFDYLKLVTDPTKPILPGQMRAVADVNDFSDFSVVPAPYILLVHDGSQPTDAGKLEQQNGSVREMLSSFTTYLWAQNYSVAGEGRLTIHKMIEDAWEAWEAEPVYVDERLDTVLYWNGDRRFNTYKKVGKSGAICWEMKWRCDRSRVKVRRAQ